MNEETQMTVEQSTGASSAKHPTNWQELPWSKISAHVFQLQVRIAKAEREGKKGRVKALQRLLTLSFYAKCLAVKRVTSNKGSKTPGVDGVVLKTSHQKIDAVFDLKRRGYNASPLRRIYIPKKSGKLRPLSIPTQKDRAMQALWQAALVPVAEERADPNAYGFRPKRSTHDAREQCFNALAKRKSPRWVLEGDISACFDRISHEWLLWNIPMDKVVLKKFLKAGFMENGEKHQTTMGTCQGGTISPTIALMALSGLEGKLRCENIRQRKKEQINVIAYADDFVVTAASKELLERKVIPILVEALGDIGLELSKEKTRITPIEKGFNFLGFNVRKYRNGKLLIKPSKANVKSFLGEIKEIIKKGDALPTDQLIHRLNQKITGWTNYYRGSVSSRIFAKIDSEIFLALKRWGLKRHPRKGTKWIIRRYYTRVGLDHWRFYCTTKDKEGNKKQLYLKNASATLIRRHKKILANANPFDPQFKEYFQKRAKERKIRENVTENSKYAGLKIIQPYEGLSAVP
jgi:RNA-directed DNA polymerase